MAGSNPITEAAKPGYKPRFLSDRQIKQESGGRQHDRNGRPLTSSAGAIGVAQVMPATAREMAADLGIPFDENRYKNDRDYNMMLGDRYQQKMNQRFGAGTREATAAYNAGPGGVERAKRRAQRLGGNWEDHLPSETQGYLGNIMGGLRNMSVREAPPIPAVLRDQGRGELKTDGQRQPVTDVFNTAPLAERYGESMTRGELADDALQQTIDGLKGIQGERLADLRERNESVRAVNSEIEQRTQRVMAEVKPMFQQRRAVQERITELSTMNPLKRGFMSLFDATYDRGHLQNVDQTLAQGINLAGEEFKTILGAQEQLLRVTQSNFEAEESESILKSSFLEQNMELAAKSFSMADTLFNQTLKGIGANREVAIAQAGARDELLVSLTPAQRMTALEKVKTSPDGTVVVQGITLNEGHLLAASQRDANQQLQLDELVEQREMSRLRNTETALAIADRSEERLISGMTSAQITQAINNGGVFQGQQLNLGRLGEGLQRSKGRDTLMVDQTMMTGTQEYLGNYAKSISNESRIFATRAVQLTGTLPTDFNDLILRQNAEMGQIRQRIDAAKAAGNGDAVARQYMPVVQKMQEERRAFFKGVADRWAGGNKNRAALASAFMGGQPISSGAALDGIIDIVKGGGDFGPTMSPEGNIAIAAARKIWQREMTPNPNDPAAMMGGGEDTKAKEARVRALIQQEVGQTMKGQVFNRVMLAAPAMAKQMRHLGKDLNPQTLSDALAYGDQDGYRTVANAFSKLGVSMSPEEAEAMFKGGARHPLAQQLAEKGVSFPQAGGQLVASQQQAAFRYLDRSHPKIGGYTAGRVFSNLLSQPQFAELTGRYAQGQAQGSFGDWMVGSISGDMAGEVSQFGRRAQQNYLVQNRQMFQESVNQASAYGSDPKNRFRVVLGAIPGVEKPEEESFFRAVIAQAGEPPKPGAGATGTPGSFMQVGGANETYYNGLRNVIMNTKFQDPGLERIRRKVAASYGEYEQVSDRVMDRAGSYSPE